MYNVLKKTLYYYNFKQMCKINYLFISTTIINSVKLKNPYISTTFYKTPFYYYKPPSSRTTSTHVISKVYDSENIELDRFSCFNIMQRALDSQPKSSACANSFFFLLLIFYDDRTRQFLITLLLITAFNFA